MSVRDRIHERSQQWQDLNTQIDELQSAQAEFTEQEPYLRHLEKLLSDKQTLLEDLRKKTRKEFKDVQELKHRTLKRLTAKLNGKIDEKLKKEESEYLAAFEQEQSEKAALSTLMEHVQEQRARHAHLKHDVAQLEQVRSQLDQLYASIFQGPTPEFPSEDMLESTTAMLLAQRNKTQADLNRYRTAHRQMTQATRLLAMAVVKLEQAAQFNTLDMFSYNQTFDLFEYGYLAEARNYAAQCQMLIDQTIPLVPETPRIRQLQVTQGNFLMNLLFDNPIIDMYIRAQLQNSMNQLIQSGKKLKSITHWYEENMSVLTAKYNSNVTALNTKSAELRAERRKIFERVLRENLETGEHLVRGDEFLVEDVIPEEAPPAYSPI